MNFGLGPHGFYLVMAYAAVALGVIAEVLAVRARRRRAFESARPAPPGTIPTPSGGA